MSFRLTKKILATIQPIIDVVTADPAQLATPFVQAFINDHFDAFRAYDLKQIKEFKKRTGIHICVNHTGKMESIPSLSTSPLTNTRCRLRCKIPGTICSHCFSLALQKRYTKLNRALRRNSDFLYHNVIRPDEWPVLFTYEIFRLEAFGDLQTVIQGINFINFTRRNPCVAFGIFTKNPDILATALCMCGFDHCKPSNMIVTYSSPYINIANDSVYIRNEWMIDHVFTVVDKNGVAAIGGAAAINCGARRCVACRKCYKIGGPLHIWEALKSQARKILKG